VIILNLNGQAYEIPATLVTDRNLTFIPVVCHYIGQK